MHTDSTTTPGTPINRIHMLVARTPFPIRRFRS
jgi:hypothetical protein